ncbi:MAG: efflux RND transporter permease subunit [Betaproteobacteria bacterium]|nr:MAG: efflux RND transporter permease subunit [Betaproteobacteria bacterium]
MKSSGFNVSAAALKHQQLTLFFIIAIAIAGMAAYFQLGQREDPNFTFRAITVRTLWPGATTSQVDQQITDRIEKKLQEMPYFKRTVSYAKPGESLIILELLDTAPKKEVQALWYQARKKVGDIRHTLPPEALGPFFNDEFGDVFGSIYAFTGDGFNLSELRDRVESVRQELLRLPDVSKIELVGVQDDKIFIEIANNKIAALGIDGSAIAAQLQAQNAIVPAGVVQTDKITVPLRVSGNFDSVAAVRDLQLLVGGKTVRVGDIATVTRGYIDPPITTMRFGGQPAIGLAISMKGDGDVIALGDSLAREMARLKADMPIGVEFHQVSDQPRIVKAAVGTFMRALFEAVGIVLVVSFLALGWRAGAVVALTIPLVLLGVFFLMKVFGIDLHRISTGALIIALGLLVDDAMIAVEMMVRKIEEGLDKFAAATFAYTSTAWPMLSGTLVTAAGFLPIAMAKSATGEYTFDLFSVTTLALIVSWFAAIIATPLFGYWILKGRKPAKGMEGMGSVEALTEGSAHHEHFDGKFYRRLRAAIDWCIEHRWKTIVLTVVGLALGVMGMGLTEKQFFPTSDRAEVMVELWLPEGASFKATEAEVSRLEKALAADKEVKTFVTSVGNSLPRFYLSLQQELFRPNFSHTLILTDSVAERDRVMGRLRTLLANDFPGVRGRVIRPQLGPPIAYPIQFRISGPEIQTLKAIGDQVAAVVRKHPATLETSTDWGDRSLAMQIEVDQDRARALGVSSTAVARTLGAAVSGGSIGQFRERDRLIDVVLRGPAQERVAIGQIADLQIATTSGRYVPLSQVASVKPVMEEPIIRRFSRQPTLTVRADLIDGVQAPDIAAQIIPQLAAIQKSLPAGYRVEASGPYEDNANAQKSIGAGAPLMLFVWLLLLMLQLQSFSLATMVLLTAPFGIVGVAIGLLAFKMPFGFVALLGVIALMGIIMRNTIILIDQIKQHMANGEHPWIAARESAIERFRPIVLTAAAAVLAMIPLTRSVLWGPMAVAIMAGLIVATVLTILAVPAIYAAWYRVKRPV